MRRDRRTTGDRSRSWGGILDPAIDHAGDREECFPRHRDHSETDPPSHELESTGPDVRDLDDVGSIFASEQGSEDVVGDRRVDSPLADDQRLVQELLAGNPLRRREPMSFRDGKHQLDRSEREVPRRLGRLERQETVDHVEHPPVQREDVLDRRAQLDLKVEIREPRASRLEDLVDHEILAEGAGPELQDRSLPGDVADPFHGPIRELEDEVSLFEEALSFAGQSDRSSSTVRTARRPVSAPTPGSGERARAAPS